jgi:perosamine synthetase
MKRRVKNVLDRVRQFIQSPYFGFVQGHSYLSPEDLRQIKALVGKQDTGVVADFEVQFAKLVGDGDAVSYAAARMGFYDLMRILCIGNGDEVILLGATCAVMVNAVLRTGATPVFSDIDPDTFGSTAKSIEACVTTHTRMIVAQHSFGIPCDIEPIVALSQLKDIFLLEDCALTLGSKVNGTIVGNFGDAALFSTDHSKPLNTLTGGLIYTRNIELARRLRLSQSSCLDLPYARQQALLRRFLLERRYCVPERYGRMGLIDLFAALRKKLFHVQSPFLSDDCGIIPSAVYPYPARLPAFLASLGLIEVKRWSKAASERKALLGRLLEAAGNSRIYACSPKAYRNECLEIVPLRFVWSQQNGDDVRESIKHFIHVSWTWFMSPIIATKEPIELFGYRFGSCPVSEHIGPDMVNLPCNISKDHSETLINLFKKTIL